jgi:ABC-type Fe3+-hydroxamate transport system substrate-binding protein
LDAVCNQHVYHFDGSALFNRPGPRLIDALEAVTKIVEDWHAAQV